MALQKTQVAINFARGLDTKTDPLQVQVGNFLSLQNTIFDKGGRLTKRNGYGLLPTLSDDNARYITTYNNNLMALGSRLSTYSPGSSTWTDKGAVQPAVVSTTSIFKSDIGQSYADSVVHTNGLICTVLTDQTPTGGGVLTPTYKYMVSDSRTGEQIVAPTSIPISSGSVSHPPKVFILGNNFVIVFINNVTGGTYQLQYVAVNAYTVTNVTANTLITSSITPSANHTAPPFEGTTFNNRLYLAYKSPAGGGSLAIRYISSDLQVSSVVNTAGYSPDILSVAADASSTIIYVTIFDSTAVEATTFQFDSNLVATLVTPQMLFSDVDVVNLATVADNGVLTIFYEQSNAYTFGKQVETNVILKTTCLEDGTVATATLVDRSVGLASKAFIINSVPYVLAIHVSALQPTYFLLNGDNGGVVAKLAYANGSSSYYTSGLPSTNVSEDTVSLAYLIKDRIEAVNKTQTGAAQTGIYSQTGINIATIQLSANDVTSAEIGKDLHLSGGILWAYDGYSPVEHGFHLWPENLDVVSTPGGGLKAQKYFYVATYEWTDAQGNIFRSAPSVPLELDLSDKKGPGVQFKATFNLGDTVAIPVNSTEGLYVGMEIQDDSNSGALAPNTKITAVGVGTIDINNATLASSAAAPGDNMSTLGIGANVTFTKGSLSLQATSVAGLRVGQVISDLTTPANLSAGTIITAIDALTKIVTVNQPTLGNSNSDQLQTAGATTNMFFEANSTELKVQSVAGFVVGQPVIDATVGGAFQPNTRITAIDSTNFIITIDKPTVTASSAKTAWANVNRGLVKGTGLYFGFNPGGAFQVNSLYTAGETFDSPAIGLGIYIPGSPFPLDVITNVQGNVFYPWNALFGQNILPAGFSWPVFNASVLAGNTGVTIYTVNLHVLQTQTTILTSTFPAGATTISVSSTGNLFPGQVITDLTVPGNIVAGTKVVSINSVAKTITIDTPTAGATTPEVIETRNIYAAELSIPTLRLTYKTANPVRIAVYRWSIEQQTYYQVTPVNSPIVNQPGLDSVTFVDTYPDANILGNNILYTTGGTVENIGAPATNIMSLYRSRLFLVDAEKPNLLWFSKQVIESTPAEMSDLFTVYVAPTTAAQGNTGGITALSSLDDKLIIFKKNALYYLTGNGPDNTGNNNDFSEPVFISSAIGCNNQKSIVFTPTGLMFQSDKGIWLLGRDLSTAYIGAPVESLTINNPVTSSVNVPGTNQVRFNLTDGTTLMYDYYFQQWSTFVGAPAVSGIIYDNLHTIINGNQQVLQETPGQYLDGGRPVLLSFTTSWLNLAGLQGFERAYSFYLLGKFLSPHKLSVGIAYDYNPSVTQQSTIVPDNYTQPYGGEQLWGSGGGWGGNGNIEQHRVFLQQQKCQAFQITVTEVYDSSQGVVSGAGLTLSGINAVVGMKSGYPRLKASKSVG